MEYKMIEELRKILVDELSEYKGDKPVKLTLDTQLLQDLIFEGNNFAKNLEKVKDKINYENVSFDGFNAKNFDFSKLTGVKINPATLHEQDLTGAICKGVEFVSTLYGVMIYKTNFKGSKGVKIDPEKIRNRDLRDCIFSDVEFEGAFNRVIIRGSDFKGSKGAKIDPQFIIDINLRNTCFCDVEFIGSFKGAQISGASFKGSKGAVVVPSEIFNGDFTGTDCCDVKFEGPLDYIYLSNTQLEGSNYKEYINYKENFREKIKLMINTSK